MRSLTMNPLISAFIQRAFDGCQELPAATRADLYEAAALLLRGHSKTQADAAMLTANALREAEALQLNFRNLFSDERRAA